MASCNHVFRWCILASQRRLLAASFKKKSEHSESYSSIGENMHPAQFWWLRGLGISWHCNLPPLLFGTGGHNMCSKKGHWIKLPCMKVNRLHVILYRYRNFPSHRGVNLSLIHYPASLSQYWTSSSLLQPASLPTIIDKVYGNSSVWRQTVSLSPHFHIFLLTIPPTIPFGHLTPMRHSSSTQAFQLLQSPLPCHYIYHPCSLWSISASVSPPFHWTPYLSNTSHSRTILLSTVFSSTTTSPATMSCPPPSSGNWKAYVLWYVFFYSFTFSHHVLHHMICSQSHSALLCNALWLTHVAAQRLTYNACRTFWNYLYKDSMECLIANTCSSTSIYSQ